MDTELNLQITNAQRYEFIRSAMLKAAAGDMTDFNKLVESSPKPTTVDAAEFDRGIDIARGKHVR